MSEEEINKTLDEIFKEDTQAIRERMKSLIKSYDNALNELVENDKKINELQKENQRIKDINVELNTDVSAWKTTVKELEEENIILEGNKIGLKLAIQELEKTIDLIIDDFQAENYFVGMTNKEVREYYKKRKELKE